MIEIEILENCEMWTQRAIDYPEEVLAELIDLKTKTTSATDDKNKFSQDFEIFNESDE